MTSKPKSGSHTILLVDDEHDLLGILAHVLETKGYEVVSASTPEAALLFARSYKRPIDLLISDMTMPGMSGVELAETIAVHQPSMAKLFISGEPTQQTDLGNAPFLAKPFPIEELVRRVESILK